MTRRRRASQHSVKLVFAPLMTIEENILLAPLTTFKIGGPARFFVRVKNIDELREALAFAKEKNISFFILGGGSNILVRDEGFPGLVIKIEIGGIEEKDGLLIAGAGEEWDALVLYVVKKNLWGIENLSGIPGSVGAAPVQNIGAYGAELKETLSFVEAFDMSRGLIVRFSNAECGFGYRTSMFKKEPGRFCITSVELKLSKNGVPNLSYRDLQGLKNPSLLLVREAVLGIRAKKFPDLTQEGTAGSFFLNPIVSKEKTEELLRRFPQLLKFPAENGVKISLAWLLDRALKLKGTKRGSARLFERQPLVIAAKRGARAGDVRELAEFVASRMREELKIEIEPEVRIL